MRRPAEIEPHEYTVTDDALEQSDMYGFEAALKNIAAYKSPFLLHFRRINPEDSWADPPVHPDIEALTLEHAGKTFFLAEVLPVDKTTPSFDLMISELERIPLRTYWHDLLAKGEQLTDNLLIVVEHPDVPPSVADNVISEVQLGNAVMYQREHRRPVRTRNDTIRATYRRFGRFEFEERQKVFAQFKQSWLAEYDDWVSGKKVRDIARESRKKYKTVQGHIRKIKDAVRKYLRKWSEE